MKRAFTIFIAVLMIISMVAMFAPVFELFGAPVAAL